MLSNPPPDLCHEVRRKPQEETMGTVHAEDVRNRAAEVGNSSIEGVREGHGR